MVNVPNGNFKGESLVRIISIIIMFLIWLTGTCVMLYHAI